MIPQFGISIKLNIFEVRKYNFEEKIFVISFLFWSQNIETSFSTTCLIVH